MKDLVKEANNLIEKLGLFDSLKRRYATVSEVPKIWIPKVEENTSSGLFDFLFKYYKKSRFKCVNRTPKQISFSQLNMYAMNITILYILQQKQYLDPVLY